MKPSLGTLTMFRTISKTQQRCFGRSRALHYAPIDFTKETLSKFREICGQQVSPTDVPSADSIERGVPIYAGTFLQKAAEDETSKTRNELMWELHRCLLDGPGVFAVQGCVLDHSVLNEADRAFSRIIKREKQFSKGDHFAPGGKNDRIWNSFQKHSMEDPKSFVDYYSNEILAFVAEAWLGPGYQITAQVNIVKPGGRAQEPHRDYHLGFQFEEIAARFPIANQIASQLLTLQGAIAHTDMPIESGPTKLLPFSQTFQYGYMASRHLPFKEIFDERSVQLPLKRGDALFFNPALFHAAGNNDTTNVHRSANLLQISAAWSKPMEQVDRKKILVKCWHDIQRLKFDGASHSKLGATIQAIADGYSFPTNLDTDPPPSNGHCPPTQQELVALGLEEGWEVEHLVEKLGMHRRKRLA